MNLLRLGSAYLALAGASLAAMACAADHANSAPASAATSEQCAVAAGQSGETPQGAPATLPASPNNAIRMDRFYTLTGACAGEAQAFEMEHILFADRRVMAIGSGNSLTLVERPTVAVEPSALSPAEAPRLEGRPLVYAARLGGTNARPPAGSSAYVGVWSVGGKSIVAAFRLGADGQASTPRPVLESELPIVGVGYFPSPDSPSGQLGLVQRVSAGTTRLLNYQWQHPGL